MKHSLFSLAHPAVILSYFIAALVACMCTLNPLFVLISLVGASLLALATAGARRTGRALLVFVPAFLIITASNALFNHLGETILFTRGLFSLSLEALIYGATSALMLLAVILWFVCYQEVMTNDKFLSLFGRVMPATSLVITMIFRFIPRLGQQGHDVLMSQKTLFGDAAEGKRSAVAYSARVTSVLMGWSLEQSIETADSMRARGYGVHHRGRYSPYRFTRADAVAVCLLVALIIVNAISLMQARDNVLFYPYFSLKFPPLTQMLAYGALVFFPFLHELKGVRSWLRSPFNA